MSVTYSKCSSRQEKQVIQDHFLGAIRELGIKNTSGGFGLWWGILKNEKTMCKYASKLVVEDEEVLYDSKLVYELNKITINIPMGFVLFT